MIKLVVGLGNPGDEYTGSRHNVGAEAVDILAARAGVTLKRKWRVGCFLGAAAVGGRSVVLAKPKSFMNLSGHSVGSLLRWQKCAPSEFLVVSDDINLELGRIRIRPGGSAGGHKGLESIIAALRTEDFARLRIGVGQASGNWAEHVLAKFSKAESRQVAEMKQRAADAVEFIISEGIEAAMNRFNAKNGV